MHYALMEEALACIKEILVEKDLGLNQQHMRVGASVLGLLGVVLCRIYPEG